MFDCDPVPVPAAASVPRLQRAFGRAEVAFVQDGAVTRLKRLYQEGQAKIRLPRVHGEPPIAVLLNTAGGITGGDDFDVTVRFGAGTTATATTQAAERIYRRTQGVGRVVNRLRVEDGARAEWLPQETILFDGCGLDRLLDIELAGSASLLAVESLVFGRTASGERVTDATLTDRWRVRRDGVMIHADTLRLDGLVSDILAGPATGGGAIAQASLLLAGATQMGRLDEIRALLDGLASEAGASQWHGLILVRMLSRDPTRMRAELAHLLTALRGRALPRMWTC